MERTAALLAQVRSPGAKRKAKTVPKVPDRPNRNRRVLVTLELCTNISAGEYGSLELIESSRREPFSAFHYWPLAQTGGMTPKQLDDCLGSIERIVTDAIVTDHMVQPSLFAEDPPSS